MDAIRTQPTVSDVSLTDLLRGHGRWLALPLGAGLSIYVAYLFSHPYPAFGSGLFMLMAEQISQQGYRLPATIPYYTARGIPFAYPPLVFYAIAVMQDLTGVGALTLSRLVPGALIVASLVPAYLLAHSIFDSKQRAAFATLLVATTPTVFQWHISSGGIVRTVAFFFMLAGLASGVRLYRTRDGVWLAPALACFVLTTLSHPKYIVFYVLSYVVFWAVLDRSVDGMAHGMFVGVGGVILTAPWWGQVIAIHGPDIFFQAASTHREVGNVALSVSTLIGYRYVGSDVPWFLFLWRILPVIAGFWLTVRRRWFVPVWLVATITLVGESRFVFLVGALTTTAFLFDGVEPALERLESPNRAARLSLAVILVVATTGFAIGTAFAASEIDSHAGTASLAPYLDDEHMDAMEWVTGETDPNDHFVVLGDSAEWFPYYTHRTILAGPWGVEWRGDRVFQHQNSLFIHLSFCPNAHCLSTAFARNDLQPAYLYVPKGKYTVRGTTHTQRPWLLTTLRASARYQLVYENSGVLIFEVDDSGL